MGTILTVCCVYSLSTPNKVLKKEVQNIVGPIQSLLQRSDVCVSAKLFGETGRNARKRSGEHYSVYRENKPGSNWRFHRDSVKLL